MNTAHKKSDSAKTRGIRTEHQAKRLLEKIEGDLEKIIAMGRGRANIVWSDILRSVKSEHFDKVLELLSKTDFEAKKTVRDEDGKKIPVLPEELESIGPDLERYATWWKAKLEKRTKENPAPDAKGNGSASDVLSELSPPPAPNDLNLESIRVAVLSPGDIIVGETYLLINKDGEHVLHILSEPQDQKVTLTRPSSGRPVGAFTLEQLVNAGKGEKFFRLSTTSPSEEIQESEEEDVDRNFVDTYTQLLSQLQIQLQSSGIFKNANRIGHIRKTEFIKGNYAKALEDIRGLSRSFGTDVGRWNGRKAEFDRLVVQWKSTAIGKQTAKPTEVRFEGQVLARQTVTRLENLFRKEKGHIDNATKLFSQFINGVGPVVAGR